MAETTEKNVEYIVVADALTVTIGYDRKRDEPIAKRMEHGASLFGLPDDPRILDFLSMGGIVEKSKAKETYVELMDGSSRNRPTVQRQVYDPSAPNSTSTVKPYRITGHGTAMTMAAHGAEAPDPVVAEASPLEAPNPDHTPTDSLFDPSMTAGLVE